MINHNLSGQKVYSDLKDGRVNRRRQRYMTYNGGELVVPQFGEEENKKEAQIFGYEDNSDSWIRSLNCLEKNKQQLVR